MLNRGLIKENQNLKNFNTFGVNAYAKYFANNECVEDVLELVNSKEFGSIRKLILGGGSNILFAGDYDGLVILNSIKGIEITGETADEIIIRSGAGEDWHEFVSYCVDKGYHGLENLALIPGKVGAAPVQNIGAYGVEQKMFFKLLEGIDLDSGKVKTMSNAKCRFGYRDSVFKNELKGKFIITSVKYRLNKKFIPNIFYKDLNNIFKNKQPSAKELFNKIIEIRRSKLPDPSDLGNSGSFFKNPVVRQKDHDELINVNPEMEGHKTKEHYFKLSAAKLIESAGWKGKKHKNTDAGVYDKHALILVNYGNASGRDIFDLSEAIIKDVKEKFGIVLEREVNVVL